MKIYNFLVLNILAAGCFLMNCLHTKISCNSSRIISNIMKCKKKFKIPLSCLKCPCITKHSAVCRYVSAVVCWESHLRCSLVGVWIGEEKRSRWKRRAKEDLQNKEKILFLSAVSLFCVLPQSATVYIPAVLIDKAVNGVMTEIIWWSWEQLVPVSASLFSSRSVECLPEASWGFIQGRHDITAHH